MAWRAARARRTPGQPGDQANPGATAHGATPPPGGDAREGVPFWGTPCCFVKCKQADIAEIVIACGGRSGTQRRGPTGQPPHRRTQDHAAAPMYTMPVRPPFPPYDRAGALRGPGGSYATAMCNMPQGRVRLQSKNYYMQPSDVLSLAVT